MGANPEPRLLVDSTAGRLARWLRLLGFDAEYAGVVGESALARLARQSGRMIVTRNRRLAERLGEQAIHLASQRLPDQLRQVVGGTHGPPPVAFSRCNVCNARLVEIPKESLAGRVPAYVYSHHDKFSACPVCGRYYWQGTHYRHMLGEIKSVLEVKRNG